jgi:hypothetical protein
MKASRAYIKALEDAGLIPKALLRVRVAKPRVQAIPPALRRQYPEWPATFTLTIDGWRPCSANDLKCHHFQQAKLKSRDRRIVGKHAALLGIPLAISKRRLTLIITDTHANRFDLDAHHKSGFDCLVSNGLLIDDNDQWMDFPKHTEYRIGPRSTTVVLEDIEPRWEPTT